MKRFIAKLLLIFAIFLSVYFVKPVISVNAGDINSSANTIFTGYVVDEYTGKPLMGISVYLNNNKASQVYTNENGEYIIKGFSGSNIITIDNNKNIKKTATVFGLHGETLYLGKISLASQLNSIEDSIINDLIMKVPIKGSEKDIILQINNTHMNVDGIKKEVDPGRGTTPVIINSRTLLPIRSVIEELGGVVEWSEEERSILIFFDNLYLVMEIGNTTINLNGENINIDTPPQIINDRTMLPIRFIADNLPGCSIEWNKGQSMIIISYYANGTEIVN